MKPDLESRQATQEQVAPRRGAWIETEETLAQLYLKAVAPRRGAWIETNPKVLIIQGLVVAPRRGAWIETGLQTRKRP